MSGARHTESACKRADSSDWAARSVVTIAGAAGALRAMQALLNHLWAPCPSAIVVTLHGDRASVLSDVLQPFTPLPVSWAAHNDLLEPGRVYVAPPGVHLVINPDARFAVSRSPRVRFYRPSADWLFESAAASFRDRHVAVVLSGMLSDGARSITKVRRAGGTVLVQSPDEAPFPDMPRAAIATGAVHKVLPIAEIARVIRESVVVLNDQASASEWDGPFSMPVSVPGSARA